MDDEEMGPFQGMLELPGVSYTITGGGDVDATTFAVRFKDSAVPALAERFGCTECPRSIKDQIVEGFRAAFGADAVSERYWHMGRE